MNDLIILPKRLALLCCMIVVSACSPQNTHNASHDSTNWKIIDDFESDAPLNDWTMIDTFNQTQPKIENPQVTEVREDPNIDNRYLLKKPAADGVLGNRKALTEIWTVVNNSKLADGGQKYDVYIRGGDEFPSQQKVYTGADFRMKRERLFLEPRNR